MGYTGYQKGNTLRNVIIVVLLMLLVAGGVFYFTSERYRSSGAAQQETPPEVIEVKTVIPGSAIQEQLRSVGELTAEEYAFTEVGSYASRRSADLFGQNSVIPLNRTTFIYSYDGTVRAGVDFTQVTVEKDDTLKRITVRLPHATLLGAELKQDSFRLFDEKNNVFNPIAVQALDAAAQTMKESAETRALEGGLLERADAQAATMVRALLEGAFDVEGYLVRVENLD